MQEKNEVGRELKSADLVVRTVYVIIKGKTGVTMWYMGKLGKFAHFAANQINMSLLLTVGDDGSFEDGSGTLIKVHEYLGEV